MVLHLDQWRRLFARQPQTVWRCPILRTLERISDRQERIAGWDQQRLASASVLFVGAGGLNGEIVEGAICKGVGTAHVADFDIVTPTNLNRQKFTPRSLYDNKAIALCRELRPRGTLGTTLVAHHCSFQSMNTQAVFLDAVVGGVDNQLPSTRLDICRFALQRQIPAIILGVTPDADGGYVFVQEDGGPCWACLFGPHLRAPQPDAATRCPESAASIDILKTLAGPALYALDSVLMARKRDWNYWTVSLSRSSYGGASTVLRRQGCPMCGAVEPATTAVQPSAEQPR